MNPSSIRSSLIFAACTFFCAGSILSAQNQVPEKPHLDKILERETFTPEETSALDLGGGGAGDSPDGVVDVRDLVVFLNGQPISASFGSAESLAFASQGGVTLPVYFSKPVTGTVSFDLGGTAEAGTGKDFTILPSSVTLNGETSTLLTVSFEPWRGVGGEKVIRISVNRDPSVIPNNGTYASHLLRIRQFDAGEFTGTLSFPPASGLPALAVRIGLSSDGSAVCTFSDRNTLLGDQLDLDWSAGFLGFPGFSGATTFSIPKETLKRTEDLAASLTFSRMAEPYDPTVEAFLEGFPSEKQPAMYHAVLAFDDLFAAGAAQAGTPGGNPFAIQYTGELALQPVNYAPLP